MGEKFEKNDGKIDGKVDRKPRKVGGNSGAAGTDTGGNRTDTGGTEPGGNGTAETEKTAEGTGVLVIDTVHKKSREEKNAERRARYAERKAADGLSVKPRKTQKKETVLKTEDVKLLLTTVFGILAARPGMEYWRLSDAEADAIAQPLTKIVAASAFGGEMEKHGDTVVLAVACVTVLLPRMVITLQKGRDKKVAKIDADKGETGGDSAEVSRQVTTPGTGVSKNLLAGYPTTA